MRTGFGLIFVGVLLVPVLFGCGPKVSEEELGTVVVLESEYPGQDEHYELPDQPVVENDSHDAHDHDGADEAPLPLPDDQG